MPNITLRRALAALLGAALAAAAWADEQAFTNRSTELKERALADARTVATLPENSSVKVLARSGAWTQVEASGQKGWVRVFHLSFPATVETSSSSSSGGAMLSGLTGALGFGKPAAKEARLASTGVRGLTPEDLKNANPDPEALRKMQSYSADKPSAEGFAREARLASNTIDYSEGGKR
jgi:hypothetical protein